MGTGTGLDVKNDVKGNEGDGRGSDIGEGGDIRVDTIMKYMTAYLNVPEKGQEQMAEGGYAYM
ncbi:hypothetical protein CVT25_003470 [Psilocybe cyanescens]|uniref:Uncharacterized protein n=1 Tax=Psilocybe cyanescens TaxID=93625 RepID=A0A409WM43_PSICY|nr:hypothetical protein CVT25_003470 [Psilocybe cyanescens]